MIQAAEEVQLTPILRMKKNTMKYRLRVFRRGQSTHRDMDVNALYQACIRGQWDKVPGQPYRAKALDVEWDLGTSTDAPERWIKVRLLFVRGAASEEKAQACKHDRAVFLTTDTHLTPQRILEIYALRWAIEVYF